MFLLLKNHKSLALKPEERELGGNDVLGKRKISDRLDVVVIDTTGTVQQYFSGPFPVFSIKRKIMRGTAHNGQNSW